MYGPNDTLPPLPDSKVWDPAVPDEYFLREEGERSCTHDEIHAITSLLESVGMPCCLVGVGALKHFRAKRVDDCVDICVPAARLSDARRALLNRSDVYTPMKTRNQFDPTMRRHTFPWFKQIGVHAFFLLIPDSELEFTCKSANIERSPKSPHLPFPKAAPWARALVDLSKSHPLWKTDLDNMVDGLALTEQWGLDNLEEKHLSVFNQSVRGTKQRMLGGKYPEDKYITRFRKRPDVEGV